MVRRQTLLLRIMTAWGGLSEDLPKKHSGVLRTHFDIQISDLS